MSTPPTGREIVAAWDAVGGVPLRERAEWARKIGISRGRLYRVLEKFKRLVPKVVPPPPVEPAPDLPPAAVPGLVEREEREDGLTVKFQSDAIVTTLDDLIAKAQADMTVWRVSTWKAKAYTVPIRVRRGQGPDGKQLADEPHVKSMWLITATFERIVREPVEDSIKALYARIADHAPVYRAVDYDQPDDGHLLVLGLTDVHIGALSWARETGENNDLKIAETRYLDAISDLIRAVRGYAIGSILLPCGSDLLHVDTPGLTTTSGTALDADGRFAKIIETVQMACVKGIELAASVAPVRVVYVPGNHDQYSSLHTARFLAAWFRNHPGVTVDCEPTTRKYHRFGTTLIGLTHGHREKRSELPIIMATERPAEWATTTSREYLCGHFHQSKVSHSTPVDSHTGVIVRTMRALSVKDAWTVAQGYVGRDEGAEGYLYSQQFGYAGHFVARPRIA